MRMVMVRKDLRSLSVVSVLRLETGIVVEAVEIVVAVVTVAGVEEIVAVGVIVVEAVTVVHAGINRFRFLLEIEKKKAFLTEGLFLLPSSLDTSAWWKG